MAEKGSDDWQHALWSGLALELLARGALASISPVLLAETAEKNWSHIFHALGFEPSEHKYAPRSIATNDVFKRLGQIIPEFTKELQDFCTLHTGLRNAELHSGETPYEGVDASSWHPMFYRSCSVLADVMGMNLELFLGTEQAEIANKLIEASTDDTAKAVLKDISAHKVVWEGKLDDDRASAEAIALVWATKHDGHRVYCPACASRALVFGEPVAAPQKSIDGDQITETQEYLPSRFECVACGLKISGLSRLTAAKLGTRYKKTSTYMAADYYASAPDQMDYEDDNNEPFWE
jgi:hypothetical protein